MEFFSSLMSFAYKSFPFLASPSFHYMISLIFILSIIVEIFFYLYLRYIVAPRLNQYTVPPRAGNYAWNHFLKTLDVLDNLLEIYPFESFISGWFDKCKFEDIRKGNAREFLIWCMYNEEMATANESQKDAANSVLENLIDRYGTNIKEGYNPNIKANRYTKDKVEYIHRPLLFYLWITVIQLFGHFLLQLSGFVRHEIHGIAYWHKTNGSNDVQNGRKYNRFKKDIVDNYETPRDQKKKDMEANKLPSLPLLFFHGISPGLNMYLFFLYMISRNREVILVEVPHICMNLGFRAKSCMDVVKVVETITKRHNIPYLAVAGHSFGSLCASWVVRHLPDITAQLILLDPVCILLTFPDVAYNFLYRKPSTLMEWILYLFGSKEITIQHALRRHFWWYEGSLFLDEVECPIFLGLGGKDEIVPSPAVKYYVDKYLEENSGVPPNELNFNNKSTMTKKDTDNTKNNNVSYMRRRVRYHYWPKNSHGDILFLVHYMKKLDHAIREQEDYCIDIHKRKPKF